MFTITRFESQNNIVYSAAMNVKIFWKWMRGYIQLIPKMLVEETLCLYLFLKKDNDETEFVASQIKRSALTYSIYMK